ncbi:MAG: hypothetical protein ACPG5R_04705 [Cognaticolwellia aestuarii]
MSKNSYMSRVDKLKSSDSPEDTLESISNTRSCAMKTVQREVKSGWFGLGKKTVTEFANPELHRIQENADNEKAKIILGAEQHQIATKAQLVKEQCDIRLKHMVSQYAQDKSKENIDRLNVVIQEIDKAHIDLQQQIAMEYDQAFAKAENIESTYVKQRLISVLESRIDNLFNTFDNQYRSLLDSFDNATQLMQK